MNTKMVLLAAAIISILLLGCTQIQSQYQSGNGRLVLGIKDAAEGMGSVSSVMVTVDSVQAHSASQGWVTLSSTPKTYDLMKLKADGSTALLADMQVRNDTYGQIRLQISRVAVTDSNGTHDAKLPSGELKIVGDIGVKANSTTIATFDFIASESLHATGNGQYIMRPVIHVETNEDGQVEVDGDGKVSIRGGRPKSSSWFEMDLNGNVAQREQRAQNN